MDILKIKELCRTEQIEFSRHVSDRMFQRNITADEVIEAVYNGKIIEEYPDDYPYPSCLIFGITFNKRFLHVVAGITDTKLWIITVYEPNPDKWNNDFTMRKG